MRRMLIVTISALALLVLAAGVYAAGYNTYYYNPQTGQGYMIDANTGEASYWSPQTGRAYVPPMGAGPATCAQPCTTACPTVCNPVVQQGYCGAFCASGQVSPGWPYGWCSDYWLRPDSNY